MRTTLLVTYAVLMAAGLVLLTWAIPTFSPEASGYGIAPATLPNVLAALITLSAAVLFFQAWRSKTVEQAPLNLDLMLHVLKYFVLLFLAFPLFDLIGFLAGGFIVLSLLQWLAGQRNWIALLLISVGIVGLFHVLALYVFNIALP